jgi:hypothetical protein
VASLAENLIEPAPLSFAFATHKFVYLNQDLETHLTLPTFLLCKKPTFPQGQASSSFRKAHLTKTHQYFH